MRIINLLSILSLILICSSCYNQRPALSCKTFAESEDPVPKNIEEWEATGRGLHVSFGSKEEKYSKGKVPMLAVTKDKVANVWKGECISFQAVLWSAFDVKQVECVWDDLVSEQSDTIFADRINTSFVRYTLSDSEFVDANSDEVSWRDSCLIPDLLDNITCMGMNAQSVRPLWININIPSDAKTGLYKSSLMVYSDGNPPQELRLNINVLDYTLPESIDWRFQTNFQFDPIQVSNYHGVKPWSSQHFKVLEPYLKMMVRAGQKSIPVSVFSNTASNASSETSKQQLVQWQKTAKGQWQADFTNFDAWVNFCFENGISSQINCKVFNPSEDNVIKYFDQSDELDKEKLLTLQKDSKLIASLINDVENHLQEKGWFSNSIFVVGIGETENVAHLKQLINSINAEAKIELVGNVLMPGLYEDVYAANIVSQYSNLKEWFKLRHQQGQETSYFVTPDIEFPNLFLHSPSAEATWLSWYAANQGMDGINISGFNKWSDIDVIDCRLDSCASGASHLIYPDARSSIRFERLIEGVQDFEKIHILKTLLMKDEAKNEQKLALIDEVLSDFVIDRLPRESAEQMIKEGQRLIEQISIEHVIDEK